jgi:hypothetical protein
LTALLEKKKYLTLQMDGNASLVLLIALDVILMAVQAATMESFLKETSVMTYVLLNTILMV